METEFFTLSNLHDVSYVQIFDPRHDLIFVNFAQLNVRRIVMTRAFDARRRVRQLIDKCFWTFDVD